MILNQLILELDNLRHDRDCGTTDVFTDNGDEVIGVELDEDMSITLVTR